MVALNETRSDVSSNSTRMVVISADGHGGPPATGFREYMDPDALKKYDAYVEQQRRAQEEQARLLVGEIGESMPRDDTEDSGEDGASAGNVAREPEVDWDADLRMKRQAEDGVVAEVLFPQGNIPFNPQTRPDAMASEEKISIDLAKAGARAYNRWLVDFCGQYPGRIAGVGVLPLQDIAAAVAEIEWAKENGLKSMYLPVCYPAGLGQYAVYNDPVYEPLWSICESLEMPLNVHGGGILPEHLGPGGGGLALKEAFYLGHRVLWLLIFSGAFERHPGLRVVFTEELADWIPDTLRELDSIMHGPMSASIQRDLSLMPSEYWARNCYVGATFMSKAEARMREEIGVDRIMWGSDFPHAGGTWPHTVESLRHTFSGVPIDEVHQMIAGNAADLFGFDLDALSQVAAEFGPTPAELAQPLTEIPTGLSHGVAYREGRWS
jgi:predicted TIM-barrel fold metal-dependent hydrolase